MSRSKKGLTLRLLLVVSAVFIIASCQSTQATPTAASKPAAPTAQPAAPAPTAVAPVPAPTTAAAPATAAAAPPAPTQAPVALKVGILASLTGASARVGLNLERFMKLYLDDLNAKGGVKVGANAYRFEPVTVDDKGTSEGGRQAADRLVLSDKVRFILGAITSPTSGAQAVTEPNKVIMITQAATDKALGTDFPLTFQGGAAHIVMRSTAIYDWLVKEHPQAKRVSLIMSDDAAGRATAEIDEAYAKSKGLTVVGTEFYPFDAKDLSPLVTRVLRQNPDAIDMGAAGARGPLFLGLMRAVNEQGYKGPVFGTSGDTGAMREGSPFIRTFTAAMLVDYKSNLLGDIEKSVFQRYIQKYGEAEVEAYPINGYNIPWLLAQGIEKAGTVEDTEKIAQALRTIEFETMWTKQWGKLKFVGTKTFGRPASLEQPVYLSKVEDGKISTFSALKATMP